MGKSIAWVSSAIAALVAVVAALNFMLTAEETPVANVNSGQKANTDQRHEVIRQANHIVKHSKIARPKQIDNMSSKDRHIRDNIQNALDEEDFAQIVNQLNAAAASTNAAVRMQAVEALQWFGEKALPELTLFMADKDDDVRTSAIDAWTMGVAEMDAGENKAATVRMGLSVVTDQDQLETMVMQVDELSDFQKLDVLTHVIEGNNRFAVEVAREHYKFWTGEEYSGLADAQKWLDNQASEDTDME